jgi:hypothetical protein
MHGDNALCSSAALITSEYFANFAGNFAMKRRMRAESSNPPCSTNKSPANLDEFFLSMNDVVREKSTAPLLRSEELENAYREASAEFDETWDSVISDGLSDETW